uniref:helix-turn-helix transcriptional regulator n=1 Tax=Burkholderia anthina TaxID=179879 RepID=UPI001588A34F|nr:helix-turn-helix domain-containing protein [Burkholderia anthina]
MKAVLPSISLDQPGLLSTANIMAILGVKSPTTISAMVREGRFPPPTLKIGRHPKWRTSVVLAFLEGHAPTDQPRLPQICASTKAN